MYRKVNLKSQPYIVICGSFRHSTCQHVIINDIKYSFVSPIKALDFCYKMFYVLNLSYTHACPHAWSFIQKYFFNMKDRKVVQAGKISLLISKLNKITTV